MKLLTVPTIRKFDPCCDPTKYVTESWSGTILDVLRMRKVPPEHKIWLVAHPRVLSVKTQRLFAVWCARRALSLIKNPDPRSVAACDVAERFALKRATKAELAAAAYDASVAVAAAAYDASVAAAAAYSAYSADAAAAYSADADAAAAYSADAAAAYSADADAADAERKAQVKQLIKMIKEGEK